MSVVVREHNPSALLSEDNYSRLCELANYLLSDKLRSKADPEDLVQESLLIAFQQSASCHAETNKEHAAWLRSILKSRVFKLAHRFLKTRSHDLQKEQPGPAANNNSHHRVEVFADQTSPSQAAVRQEVQKSVQQTLTQLPSDYAQVLQLRTIEGHPFTKVAEEMGRSTQAVIMLWTRAVQAFRKQHSHSL